MEGKENHFKQLALRVMSCLMTGILISIILMGMISTHSLFKGKRVRNIGVNAASTENIINEYKIEYDKEGNAEIHVRKARGLDYAPVIYFCVEEGERATKKTAINLPDYVLHINSVKLESEDLYIIPIELNINHIQWGRLVLWDPRNKKSVIGKVKIKYLNEYIDEGLELSFDTKYIKEKYLERVERKDIEIHNTRDQELVNAQLADMIMSIADFGKWQTDYEENEHQSVSKSMEMEDTKATVQNEKYQNEREKEITNEVEKIVLSQQQEKIIDTIAPNLIHHLKGLYRYIEELIDLLNEKIAQVAKLKNKISQLESENQSLLTKIEDLKTDHHTASSGAQNKDNSSEKSQENSTSDEAEQIEEASTSADDNEDNIENKNAIDNNNQEEETNDEVPSQNDTTAENNSEEMNSSDEEDIEEQEETSSEEEKTNEQGETDTEEVAEDESMDEETDNETVADEDALEGESQENEDTENIVDEANEEDSMDTEDPDESSTTDDTNETNNETADDSSEACTEPDNTGSGEQQDESLNEMEDTSDGNDDNTEESNNPSEESEEESIEEETANDVSQEESNANQDDSNEAVVVNKKESETEDDDTTINTNSEE